MAKTPSTMVPLGTQPPDFSLPDLDGKMWSLRELEGRKALLVMVICNHCPYVKHINEELGRLTGEYLEKGVAVVALMPNDAESYPDDDIPHLKSQSEQYGFSFPYLLDADQSVSKTFRAACTPDFFLYDAGHRLVYRGQMDDSRPDSGIPVTGQDLRAALDALLEGREISPDQKPSLGCNIKWKPGNEPTYFAAR